MNKTIYKYPVQLDAVQSNASIDLPVGAHILSVAVQGQKTLCVWALVDPEAPKDTRRFRIIATGERFDPTGMTYIGTFHGVAGWMVFHLFEM